MALPLSRTPFTVQPSVYGVRACWRSKLGQDTPSMYLALADTPVYLYHYRHHHHEYHYHHCSKNGKIGAVIIIAGIVGRQLTLGRRASTMSRFSMTLPRNPSSAAALLQSGDSLDAIPAGMLGADHRRRSTSMGHMQGPSRLLSRATSRFQDYAPRDTRYVITT